ncbi:MAG: hypothetical protein ACK5MT_16660 [Actinomycetales bacterium]
MSDDTAQRNAGQARPSPPAEAGTLVLDWSDRSDPTGAHEALLRGLAKVRGYVQGQGSAGTPAQEWAIGILHLPYISARSAQTFEQSDSNRDSLGVQASETIASAGGQSSGAAEAARRILPEPAVGCLNVLEIVTEPEPGIGQVVLTYSTTRSLGLHPVTWHLAMSVRTFAFDWRGITADPATRSQWDSFVSDVTASTITDLPGYHQLAPATG